MCVSIWCEVQIVCIWSSWCHCHPKPYLNPDWFTFLVPAYPGCWFCQWKNWRRYGGTQCINADMMHLATVDRMSLRWASSLWTCRSFHVVNKAVAWLDVWVVFSQHSLQRYNNVQCCFQLVSCSSVAFSGSRSLQNGGPANSDKTLLWECCLLQCNLLSKSIYTLEPAVHSSVIMSALCPPKTFTFYFSNNSVRK